MTNIDASGSKGIEFTLPGVHSDIGGGYRDQSRENVIIHKETLYYKGKPKECEEYKKILIEEGWYTEKDIEIREVVTEGVFYSIYQYLLIGKRKLSNQYDRISLQKMLEYSKQFGVKYQQKVQSDHKISDPFIQKIYAQLQSYFSICNQIRNTYIYEQNKGVKINEQEYLQKIKQISYLKYIPSADLKRLRNGYLHWSSNLNRAGMEPRIAKPKPQQERTRTTLKG